MTQLKKISRNNTATGTRPDGSRFVILHNTTVVDVAPSGTVRLNTGGWLTVTTMARMNQAAGEWDLDFRVSRAKGKFSAYRRGTRTTVFSKDGTTITLPA